MSRSRRPLFIGTGLFGLWFLVLAVQPHDRGDWLLENLLVVPFVVVLNLRGRRRPLPAWAYVQIFAFLALHEVGSHYTYSRVPYESWVEALGGSRLSEAIGLARNSWDRLVHLAFGLLLARPLREALGRAVRASPGWLDVLSIGCIAALSLLYELVEWGAAFVLGRDLGIAFVGAQGDPWDAQRDSSLAVLGSVLAIGAGALRRLRRRALSP